MESRTFTVETILQVLTAGTPSERRELLYEIAHGSLDQAFEVTVQNAVYELLTYPDSQVAEAAAAAILRLGIFPPNQIHNLTELLYANSPIVRRAVLEVIRPTQLTSLAHLSAVFHSIGADSEIIASRAFQLVEEVLGNRSNAQSLYVQLAELSLNTKETLSPTLASLIRLNAKPVTFGEFQAQERVGGVLPLVGQALECSLVLRRLQSALKDVSESESSVIRSLTAAAAYNIQPLIEIVIPLLDDTSEEVRLHTIVAIRHIYLVAAQIRAKTIDRLHDESSRVRSAAATSFGSWHYESANELLSLAKLIIGDEDSLVRLAASSAFGRIVRKCRIEVIPAIDDIVCILGMGLESNDPDVCFQASVALSWLGSRAAPIVGKLVKSLDRLVQGHEIVLHLIAEIGTTGVNGNMDLDPLYRAAQNSNDGIRELALHAIDALRQ